VCIIPERWATKAKPQMIAAIISNTKLKDFEIEPIESD
jgi:hypothetical protein